MKDLDLQHLFDYFDAPSHAFHSIRRREALADVVARWPVLGEANDLVLELIERTKAAPGEDPLPALVRGDVVDVSERLR